MDNNHKLALFVAYYLSRFDREGYNNLGYRTMNEAHKELGRILHTNPHTVKNMRDQFDPLHNHRVGWYQAPLSPSRVNVVEALQHLSEEEIRSIVIEILDGSINEDEYQKNKLISLIDAENDNQSNRDFILRGPTGKKAEEFFIKYHIENMLPISGELIDMRDFGKGYDFEINVNGRLWFIEIKGLAEVSGGVLLTSKEWETAKLKQDKYFLVIVFNLNTEPFVRIIQNPFAVLNPKKNITKSIQINYTATKSQLEEAINK